jgi:hypothetical protein
MKTVPDQYVPTKTPDTFIDLFKQRIYSWDYVILKFIPYYFRILFNLDLNNFILKILAFYNLWTIIQDFIRIPNLIIISFVEDTNLFIMLYITIGIVAKSMCILLLLLVRNSYNAPKIPRKQCLYLLVVFPVYAALTYIFRMIGQLRYLIFFEPRIKNNIKLEDRPQLPNITKFHKLNNINWQQIYNINRYGLGADLPIAQTPLIFNPKTRQKSDHYFPDINLNVNHTEIIIQKLDEIITNLEKLNENKIVFETKLQTKNESTNLHNDFENENETINNDEKWYVIDINETDIHETDINENENENDLFESILTDLDMMSKLTIISGNNKTMKKEKLSLEIDDLSKSNYLTCETFFN